MIEVMFEQGNEVILVVIEGSYVRFGNTSFGAQLTDISGLKLDYTGVVREFPDLETNPKWEQEAIDRFKDHLKKLKTEEEKCDYIIKELESCGYVAKQKRRNGFRPINLK